MPLYQDTEQEVNTMPLLRFFFVGGLITGSLWNWSESKTDKIFVLYKIVFNQQVWKSSAIKLLDY